jgi:hypothetical protein
MPGFVAAMRSLLDINNGVVIIGHQTRRALILDETKTPMMVNDDVSFKKFKELCFEAGFYIRELGKRESPGFPGPLYMFACAREEQFMDNLPLAFIDNEETLAGGVEQAEPPLPL